LFDGNIRAKSAYSFQAIAFHCPARVVALKALRFATPALRAAIGLERASREPRIAIIDGPLRDALDDAGRRRYSRTLVDGCYSQLPLHRPM
jgi:hypothetical protein